MCGRRRMRPCWPGTPPAIRMRRARSSVASSTGSSDSPCCSHATAPRLTRSPRTPCCPPGAAQAARRTRSARTMNDDCGRVDAVAGELALGLLTGLERARALAHLEECHACRTELATLSDAADAVLLLAPAAAPDPGFER